MSSTPSPSPLVITKESAAGPKLPVAKPPSRAAQFQALGSVVSDALCPAGSAGQDGDLNWDVMLPVIAAVAVTAALCSIGGVFYCWLKLRGEISGGERRVRQPPRLRSLTRAARCRIVEVPEIQNTQLYGGVLVRLGARRPRAPVRLRAASSRPAQLRSLPCPLPTPRSYPPTPPPSHSAAPPPPLTAPCCPCPPEGIEMGQVVLAGDAPSSRPRVKFQNDVRRPPTPAPHLGAFAPSAVREDRPAHARRLSPPPPVLSGHVSSVPPY